MAPSPDVRSLPPWHPVVLRRTWSRFRGVAVVAAVALAAVTALTFQASLAVFSVSAETGENSWRSGRVALSHAGSGSAVFNVPGMLPGDVVTRCIRVDYGGNLEADVRLYLSGTSGPGSLADHLEIAVATGVGSDPACGDFRNGVARLPATGLRAAGDTHAGHATGIGSWRPVGPSGRTYRITVSLPSTAPSSAQGRTATTTFVWEARST